MLRLASSLALALCLGRASSARADKDWPVRVNLSMPLGYTFGSERLHGFTWGFRGSAHWVDESGVTVGGHAEMLLDAKTHSMSSFGASVAVPVTDFELDPDWYMDWRVGACGGVRYSGEGNDDDARLATAVFTELAVPAYLYEFRVGVRVDGTFHDGLSSTTVAADLDLVGLVGLIAWGLSSN